jgi:hypothetical protein
LDIINRTDMNTSWFCYNSDDVFKWVALGSGDLKAGGGSFSYQPPNNKTMLYFVRFTHQGGGLELAGGITKQSGQTISLVGSQGRYHAEVRDN